MDHIPGFSRRALLKAAAVAGAGPNTLLDLHSSGVARAQDVRATSQGRALCFNRATNAAVTVSRVDGRLVVEVQGVLWSVPADGGEARALTEPDLEPTRPSWAPDGSRLAVVGYRGGGFHVWTLAPDGTGLRQVTEGPWDDRGASWSPDATRIAFSSERGGDPATGSSYDIWTVEVATGRLTRLTDEPGVEDYDPVWHPDGERVLFVRADLRPEGKGARTLASAPAGGGPGSVVRTVGAGQLACPAVSATGRIAYVLLGDAVPPVHPETSVLVVNGEVVSGHEDVSPAPPCWTPDGDLVYMADGRITVRRPPGGGGAPSRATAAGTAGARVVPFRASLPVPSPFRSTGRRKAYRFDALDARPVRGVHLPVLSPDGASVAFAALGTLWVQRVGGRPRPVLRGAPTAYVQMPAWAPDGRSLLYVYDGPPPTGSSGRHDGLSAVYRVPVGPDGARGPHELLADGGRFNPALSPDGTRLACQDATGALVVRDLVTGLDQSPVSPLGANGLPSKPSWSADGRRVAFCDRNRLNARFREGYNVIRVIDTANGSSAVYQPAPHASLSDRGNGGPVWSPDGASMAFVMESALWVMPVERDGAPAGPPRRITDERADHPSWSGDSGTLLYESAGRLRTVRPDGTGRRAVAVPLTHRRSLPPRERVTRIHAGRLWDGTGDVVREDMDVVVRGHRVESVERHRPPRTGERTVDATGATVLPGLWDAHTHPWQYTYGGRQALLGLAYGITTTVSLGGFAHEGIRLRESLESGAATGPRLLATGELIDGSRVAYSMGRAHRTDDGVRRSLDRAVALDHDYVKTYVRAPAATMRRAAETAHERLGVLSGSHLLSPGVNVGQDMTTHLQATQRGEYGRACSPTGRSYGDVLETYRGGDFAMVVTPFSALALLAGQRGLAEDPRAAALMPPWDAALVARWAAAGPDARMLAAMDEEMAAYRRVVTEGGMLALGTDAPLSPIGLGLHLGLRALHRSAGLPVADALRAATSVPARLFGVDGDLGTVEPGKLADLTAVRGNPFEDADALADTAWAMRDGVLHRREDLVAAGGGPSHGERAPAERAAWLEAARALRREPCCGHVLPV